MDNYQKSGFCEASTSWKKCSTGWEWSVAKKIVQPVEKNIQTVEKNNVQPVEKKVQPVEYNQ